MSTTVSAPPVPRVYASVPKLCLGGTVVCIAGGPSLTVEDVEYCRTRVSGAIVINNAYQIAPWATVLYAADAHWWGWHKGAPSFTGLKYTLSRTPMHIPGLHLLRKTGDEGLELNPNGLRTGRNGGYQAINLAVHLGAVRIILLGYDMQKGPRGESHWHGDHPRHTDSPYAIFLRKFDTLIEPLQRIGVDVVNCTRRTALKAFRRAELHEVLP